MLEAGRPTAEGAPQRRTEPSDPSTGGRSAQTDEKLERLKEIVRKNSLREGEKFKLASGRTSTFYFDMKRAAFHPEGANLISELILDKLADEKVDRVGGMEMGAVPIASCVALKSAATGRPVHSFAVRKLAKEHGTKRVIEGDVRPGMRAVVLDDVTTTGGSALEAVEAIRSANCTVETAVTVVDRLEGAAESLATHGVRLVALLTVRDFDLDP